MLQAARLSAYSIHLLHGRGTALAEHAHFVLNPAELVYGLQELPLVLT